MTGKFAILSFLMLLVELGAAVRTNGTQQAGHRPNGRDQARTLKIKSTQPLVCDDRVAYEGDYVSIMKDEKQFIMIPDLRGNSGDLYFFYQQDMKQVRVVGDMLSNYLEFQPLNLDSDSGTGEDLLLVHAYPEALTLDHWGEHDEPRYLAWRLDDMKRFLGKDAFGLLYRYGNQTKGEGDRTGLHHTVSIITDQNIETIEMAKKDQFSLLYHERPFDINEAPGDILLPNKGEDYNLDAVFIHLDFVKQFRVEYSGQFLRFKYYTPENELVAIATRKMDYNVKQVVYYEPLPFPIGKTPEHPQLYHLWSAIIIEVDSYFSIHFNRYVFQIDPDARSLEIVSRTSHRMLLEEFFGCQRRKEWYPVRRPDQVKGVIFLETDDAEANDQDLAESFRTLVFFDFFFLVVKANMVTSGFNLNSATLPKAKHQLQITKFQVPVKENEFRKLAVERLSTKYVKSCGYAKNYFVFDPTAEQVVAYESDDPLMKKSHAYYFQKADSAVTHCPMSTLLVATDEDRKIRNMGVCFNKHYYHFVSTDGFKTYNNLAAFGNREAIADLFADTPLKDIQDEAFELVFQVQMDTVVFLSSQWLIIMDIRDLYVVGKYEDGERVHIKWGTKQGRYNKAKGQIDRYTYYFYVRMRNCLWTSCTVEAPRSAEEQIKFDRRLMEMIRMNQTYDPYLKPAKKPASERLTYFQAFTHFGRLPSVMAVLSMIVLLGWMIHLYASSRRPAEAEFDSGSNAEPYRATENEVPHCAEPAKTNLEPATLSIDAPVISVISEI